MTGRRFEKMLQLGKDETDYRLLTKEYVSTTNFDGNTILRIDPRALTLLAKEAMHDVSFYLRAAHLAKLRLILDDPEASENDRFVALSLLKNSVIAAEGELPTCQDTGTAIVMAKKGQRVWTGCDDEEYLTAGIYTTFSERNLRYSQLMPISMFNEKNTADNLPAQVDILATDSDSYEFLFLTKGGGSANKTFLFQENKSLLNDESLTAFMKTQLPQLGTSACPPYHLAVVIGGTSVEMNLKTVKLASAGYLDNLPTEGSSKGIAFRDKFWEGKIARMAQETGIGAQFGGKYLVHDVRVIRMPRHTASCPVGIGVSCSADRNVKGKITKDGVYLEDLEKNPARFLPEEQPEPSEPVKIDLDVPLAGIIKELRKYPVRTRLSLSGTLIVARDTVHAKLAEMLDRNEKLPDYMLNHPIYYAGPAKKPKNMPSGSFGPTTAGRMDCYVERFMERGASRIMIAKGDRSPAVREACRKYQGFYLGSIGGPAALLAKENIVSVEVIDFEELGMEAVRRIRVKDFPAFIITDDKGNDFFEI